MQKKHVLNGDPKFVEVNGSSNKLKDDEKQMHQESMKFSQ